MDTQRQWWTAEQVAALLDVRVETVRRWLRTGALHGTMIGGTKLGYRVARADLDAFVQLRFGTTLGEWRAAA